MIEVVNSCYCLAYLQFIGCRVAKAEYKNRLVISNYVTQ